LNIPAPSPLSAKGDFDMSRYLLVSLLTLQLPITASAFAQTTPPGVTAAPEVTGGTAYWLWALIALALIAMGIWYFTSRRRR